jgi:hypothetical protein
VSDLNAIEAPRVFPTLRCDHAEAMIRWLADVFGFPSKSYIDMTE